LYIYVTKFSNHPNMIKIGKSTTPVARTAWLVRSHGEVISTDVYNVGEGYSEVEKDLHKKYEAYKASGVVGDGYTEFFLDSISDSVCKDLEGYLGGTFFSGGQLKSLAKKEEIRYYRLMARLFGCRYYNDYNGEEYKLPVGHMDGIRIMQCLELGFSKDEVARKFVESKVTPCYTTVGRVKAGYELFLNGSTQYRLLHQLVKESA